MRFLFTILVCLCTFCGYTPSVWAAKAAIVHFIFYPDDVGSADSPYVPGNGVQNGNTCNLTQNDCHGRAILDEDTCRCECNVPINQQQQTCAEGFLWNNDDDVCDCEEIQIECDPPRVARNYQCQCENPNHTYYEDTNTCACPNNCNGNLNASGWELSQDNNDCSCSCFNRATNQSFTWYPNTSIGNIQGYCQPEENYGCDLGQLASSKNNQIFDRCCAESSYDSNGDLVPDACCDTNRLYDSNGDGENNACCDTDLVNGVCPCGNGIIYQESAPFFTGDLVRQAQRDCACPTIGNGFHLTEIDNGNGTRTCTLQCPTEETINGTAYNDYKGGVLATAVLNYNNGTPTFHCGCVAGRHFKARDLIDENGDTKHNELYTNKGNQANTGSRYCACDDDFIRVLRTDRNGREIETCEQCSTYGKDPSLFEYIVTFYAIDPDTINNKGTTKHCPSNSATRFASQTAKLQVVGLNPKQACPPHAAMTHEGTRDGHPTCTYSNTDAFTYCFTDGLPPNTYNGEGCTKGTEESCILKKCSTYLSDITSENRIRNLLSLVADQENFGGIESYYNDGTTFIIYKDNLDKLKMYGQKVCNKQPYKSCCDVRNNWACYNDKGEEIIWTSIVGKEMMYYGLQSTPFKNGKRCESKPNRTTRSRKANGDPTDPFCVCKPGFVPTGIDENWINSDGLLSPEHCTSFDSFRIRKYNAAYCFWKGCTGNLQKIGSAQQTCTDKYVCSTIEDPNKDYPKSNLKANYRGDEERNLINICKPGDQIPAGNCEKDAGKFGVCTFADDVEYYWDDEVRGGQLDQDLLLALYDASGDADKENKAYAAYIRDYYLRACSSVQHSLPPCTEGASIFNSEENEDGTYTYTQVCNCDTVDNPKAGDRCCGFGQYFEGNSCQSCSFQYYYDRNQGACVSCDISERKYLTENATCKICPGRAFPVSYVNGCHTCGTNRIPKYVRNGVECNDPGNKEGCEWECTLCDAGTAPAYVDETNPTNNCDENNPTDNNCKWICQQSTS